jgi:PAS domain S-box-containing protein
MVINEQRRTKLVLKSIADGVCTVDLDLRIRALNPAAELITGWSEAEALGKSCDEVFCDVEDGEANHQCILIQQALQSGRSVSSDPDIPPVRTRDGSTIFLASSVAPIYSQEGGLEGAVVAFRDVSSERELDRLKSDFISMISHELRSPLANLGAAIELMQGITQGQNDVQRTLEIAASNEQRLTRLVEDILNVSKLEAGQMRVHQEPVTLLPILRRVVRLAQSQTRQHRIVLQAPESMPFVLADQSKVEIVLSNLITNAINYSPTGGRILIRVVGPKDGAVSISVIDEGVGISGEHLEKIFERFYRVDTSDGRKVYGHGLGLYISRRFVELQGGTISVQSKEGYGSCFTFTLPLVESPEAVDEEVMAVS